MSCLRTVVFCVLITRSWSLKNVRFPSEFKFGVSTAAYQVEGAWNVSDKSESIWDRLLHTNPSVTSDGSNGDVACDSYHLWKRDIEMVQKLGVNVYRFSISWPRLLPSGFTNHISKDGLAYYNNLIDGLLAFGIEPMVTIYHWDLPQSLQDLGGWTNPLITDWFAAYARVVYSHFADRVKIWLTVNEPFIICDGGYNQLHAPRLNSSKVGVYLCNKHVMLAHAKAYRIYDEDFKPFYHGKVSLSNLFFWFKPEGPEDREATDRMIELWEGRYAHPVYSKTGGWPPALEKILNENARKEGYTFPRLPPFTKDEIDLIKGTYDFYGLNHYTTRLVRKVEPTKAGSWPFYGSSEIGVSLINHPKWSTNAASDYLAVYPEGLREQLHWINRTYGVKEILITENGFPSSNSDLFDNDRLTYIRSILEQVLLAVEDGLPVIGYTAWSLMDSFEWDSGYEVGFGLYAVDYTSPLRTRIPRESARYYSSVIRTRCLQPIQGLNYTF